MAECARSKAWPWCAGRGAQVVAKRRGVTWEWLRREARWRKQPRVKEDPEGPCSVASPFSRHHDPTGVAKGRSSGGPFLSPPSYQRWPSWVVDRRPFDDLRLSLRLHVVVDPLFSGGHQSRFRVSWMRSTSRWAAQIWSTSMRAVRKQHRCGTP